MTDFNKLIYGGSLMLFVGSGTTKQPLAYSKNAKINVSTKTREVTSKDSGNWTDKLSGIYDWNCSTDGLLSYTMTGGTNSIDKVYDLFITGLPVNVAFATATGTSPSWTVDSTKKAFTGMGIITSIELNAPENDTATYSINIEGTGSLTLI